jgi:hypothetical protein
MNVIITASGKPGHSILTTESGAYFYEVKGSPESIRNRIDKEEAGSESEA